jgi:UDP-3-O-[3-hydroxymyristoyl] glucosamine N-acyltransferase
VTFIHETAVITPETIIGDDCWIGPGVCIGQRGFGYQPDDQGEWQYRPHPYGVIVGDNVSVGANSVIDGGRHRETVIGAGTKIDAHCFIAHNVHIGRRCLIIANSMIAGSCEIGDDCWIGPAAQLTDHVNVGERARVGLGSVVLRNVPAGQLWVGNPARYLRDTVN